MNDTLLSDRRDLVIDQLSSAYAGGHLEVDELERRLVRAHAAQQPAELDGLVTDLVPIAPTTALVSMQRMSVLFGSVARTGPWAVPQQLSARVVCGSLLIDLREARLEAGETTIDIDVTLGNVEVIIPPDVRVEVSASSVFGNAEERVEHALPANRPTVRIVGRVRLGNLEVETRWRGESARAARRRRRAQCRAQRRRHWRHRPDTWLW